LNESDTESLSAAQLKDVEALLVALDHAVRPFVRRKGGITYAPVLHALAVFLAAQAVAADEPIGNVLGNLRLLYADCLAQVLIHQEAIRAVPAC
jgi:hypothetical protein